MGCLLILQGYYLFSQKMKHIIRLPFAIIAYGMLVPVFEFCSAIDFLS